MKPIKLFRSIAIDKVEVKQAFDSGERGTSILRVEGWAYKSKTYDGRYIIDSDNENIDTNNVDLARFHQGTMPLLFSHDQTQIVGKIVGAIKEPEGLKIVADMYDFPNDALSTYVVPRVKAGLISAFSIGVLVKDFDLIEQDGEEYLQIKESEAFEVSLVSVPANSSALFSIIGETGKELTLGVSKSALKADNPNICKDLESCGIQVKSMETKAIKNSTISTKPWGDVDKTALAHKVQDLGIKYINEAYLYVGDPEKVSTYKLPHHEVRGGDLIVNKNGVQAAYAALQGAHGNKPDLSSDELAKAKAHLRKHYREMISQGIIDEMPEGLKEVNLEETILKGKEMQTDSVKGTETETEETETQTVEPEKGIEETKSEPEETSEKTSEETDEKTQEDPQKEEEASTNSTQEEQVEEKQTEEETSEKEPEEESETITLETSLSYLQSVEVDTLDEEQLETVYEIVATLAEQIEAKVVEQLKETLQEIDNDVLSA